MTDKPKHPCIVCLQPFGIGDRWEAVEDRWSADVYRHAELMLCVHALANALAKLGPTDGVAP